MSSKKVFWIYTVIILTVGIMIGVGLSALVKADAMSLDGAGCQYPARKLIEGKCDNSDPACPETIKEDGGDCSSKEQPKPVVEPTPEPVYEEFGK